MDKLPALYKLPVSLRIITFGLIVLSCVILIMIFGIVLAVPFFGPDVMKNLALMNDSKDPGIIALAKYFQVVSQLGMFIVPVILFAFLDGRNIGPYLKINSRPAFKTMLFAAAAILASTPLINYLSEINQQMALPSYLKGIEHWMKESEDKASQITETFLHVTTTGGFLLNILMIGIIPAIGEEFLFRGVLQKLFLQGTKNVHFAVIFSAFLFSAIHMQFYGFVPRFMMGIFLGYALVWSGSLWVPILIHFVNNTAAVIVSFYVNKGTLSDTFDTIGTGAKAILPVIISLVLTSGFIYLIYSFEKKKRIDNIIAPN